MIMNKINNILLYFCNFFQLIFKLFFAIFFIILLNQCSKKDPVTGEKVRIEPNAIKKAEAARDKGGSIIFGTKKKEAEGKLIGNSSILLY